MLPRSDDQWRLDQLLEGPQRGVRLVNIHTGHVIKLQLDNIREYRSPDFLLLRCQLTVRVTGIKIEPIVGRSITEHGVFMHPGRGKGWG